MIKIKIDFMRKNFMSAGIFFRNSLASVPFISGILNGQSYACNAFSDEKKSFRRKQQLKSIFGAILNPFFTLRWYEILKSPGFNFITEYRKRIYIKPYRVYMSTKWKKEQKIKVICDTYKFISKTKMFEQLITCKEGLEIAAFKLNGEIEASVTLGYDERFRKEGELVLSFDCNHFGGRIVAASFSFEEEKNENWVCRIGCIQGKKQDFENSSKKVQKLLNGLRPKSLIVFMMLSLCKELGCTSIYGVGDSIQAYRQKHAIHLHWIHKINFDYDAIWNESGGKLNTEGWYELPLSPTLKSIEDIKSHKRAVYRRRYAQMDEISLKIKIFVKENI